MSSAAVLIGALRVKHELVQGVVVKFVERTVASLRLTAGGVTVLCP